MRNKETQILNFFIIDIFVLFFIKVYEMLRTKVDYLRCYGKKSLEYPGILNVMPSTGCLLILKVLK